jgi:hypothetical protein
VNLSNEVKLTIYQAIVDAANVPTAEDVAAMLDKSVGEVDAAFGDLANQRLLVLEQENPRRIRMAPPFAGIPTQHIVTAGGKSYFANCAWDALGISAALHQDADITSVCPDCGQQMSFQLRDGMPIHQECVIHFAVPAAQWWDDIV